MCRVCFNASSHKKNPTLRTVEQTEGNDKDRHCKACGQKWHPLRVVRGSAGKWYGVRPRPTRVTSEYQLCNYREKCQKATVCTFAHSPEELEVWNRERSEASKVEAPRPFPDFSAAGVSDDDVILQLCKNQMLGSCTYGRRCTFAHTETELRVWTEELNRRRSSRKSGASSHAPSQPMSTAHYCPTCQVQCNSAQMLQDHLRGSKHASKVQSLQTMRVSQTPKSTPVAGLRAPPAIPFIREYKLCWTVAEGRRCHHGSSCTYAHSEAELHAWNSDKARSEARSAGRDVAAASAMNGFGVEPVGFVEKIRQEITHMNPSPAEVGRQSHSLLWERIDACDRCHTTICRVPCTYHTQIFICD